MQSVLRWTQARLRRLTPLLLAFGLVTGGVVVTQVVASAPAFAGTDTYPTSIAGCRNVATAATVTCDLKDSAQDMYFDPWGEYNRECTSYVAWMLHSVNGFNMPFHADASNWKADAQNDGYTVNSTPAPGAVGWTSGGDHVVWIESVNSDGTVNTEGYNDPAGSGTYMERLNQPASTYQYIHFDDLSGSGGGTPTGSVLSAVAIPNGQQMVFWKGGDGNLDAAYWNGSAWSKQSIGSANGFGQLYSPPAAVYQPSTGWVQVFWEGPGHTLYQAVLNTSTGAWVGGWNLSIASTVYSQPTAAVNGSQVDVFWMDNGGKLQEAVWNGSAWIPFSLGSNFYNMGSAPTAYDQSSGENDVYWTDVAGDLVEGVWNGSAWDGGWAIPVGLISSQPAADLEPTTNYQDVFWKDGSNLKEAVWNGSIWAGPFTIPGATTLATAPTSTAWGSEIDVYWTDSGGNLQEVFWNGIMWNGPFTISGMGPIPDAQSVEGLLPVPAFTYFFCKSFSYPLELLLGLSILFKLLASN